MKFEDIKKNILSLSFKARARFWSQLTKRPQCPGSLNWWRQMPQNWNVHGLITAAGLCSMYYPSLYPCFLSLCIFDRQNKGKKKAPKELNLKQRQTLTEGQEGTLLTALALDINLDMLIHPMCVQFPGIVGWFIHTQLGTFLFMVLPLCTRALSCWHRKGPSPNSCHTIGSMFLSKIFLVRWSIKIFLNWN